MVGAVEAYAAFDDLEAKAAIESEGRRVVGGATERNFLKSFGFDHCQIIVEHKRADAVAAKRLFDAAIEDFQAVGRGVFSVPYTRFHIALNGEAVAVVCVLELGIVVVEQAAGVDADDDAENFLLSGVEGKENVGEAENCAWGCDERPQSANTPLGVAKPRGVKPRVGVINQRGDFAGVIRESGGASDDIP